VQDGRLTACSVHARVIHVRLTGLSNEFLPASVPCALIDMRVIGQECFLTYQIKRQRRRPS
jgi:hypothetical protein